ncbi:MAG: hypothetical protein H7338_22115 [Candidatus Sericytochromatia bacterium]|nr:hypothetical protein [Candidatus Sericytochromatia bacterium]
MFQRFLAAGMAVAMAVGLMSGCSGNSSGLASASQSGTSNAVIALAGMTVTKSVIYRDGGTIVIDGKLADASPVKLRLDGAMGSVTRGTFFVTVAAATERLLDRNEAASIIPVLEKALAANDPNADPRVVEPFVDKLKAFRDAK